MMVSGWVRVNRIKGGGVTVQEASLSFLYKYGV